VEATVETQLGQEAVDLLCELIRLDTSNPPNKELPVQELLAERLGAVGFECELLHAADPERPNLLARLRGDGDGPTLCLLGHADTVPAGDEGQWSFSPWAGDVVDGEVRGRGAQDMKDQVAAEVAACIALAREGWRPKGELLLVCTADEEAGAHVGAKWLCEEHPDKVRADLVINEGGGASFEFEGRRLYTLCVGEKGVWRFRLRAEGKAGHGSVPSLGDNALIKLAPLLERLREQPPPEPTEAGTAFLSGVLERDLTGAGPGELEAALAELRDRAPLLAAYLGEPMLRVTLVPTMASASDKDNVIPGVAEILVDCRVPPGLGEDHVRERIGEFFGHDFRDPGAPGRTLASPASPVADAPWEETSGFILEFQDRNVGNASPAASPLADSIADWVDANDPGAGVVPIVMPGFSDSHWWRKAFGSETTVYGFSPQRDMDLFEASPLVHSADERIKASDVEFAARFYEDITREVLG
jgi:acetylornithine deacetylase/succinyl-diaminopimelate desuccinylase-like protein